MNQPAENPVTVKRLLILAQECVSEHWRTLALMSLLAGVGYALLLGPLFYQLPEAILNFQSASEEEFRAAATEAAPLFWPFLLLFCGYLLVQSAIVVPWARLTSSFPLVPLGQRRSETGVRIVRVFFRQIGMLLYWLFVTILVMMVASAISAVLPAGVSELFMFLAVLFIGLVLLVFASFLHTLIIAESCFGKAIVPAMTKATRLMITPLAGSLFALAIFVMFAQTVVTAIIIGVLPESVDLTAKLVMSGAGNFVVSALHIGAINRLPLWLKAASD